MGEAIVIGAGPAGLMAAEVLAAAGHRVTLAEAKPSPARKLLMAGKSGLNLTKAEPLPAFLDRYEGARSWLAPILARFGPDEVATWARGLGEEVFTGSTGRVFPVAMKASPLLRAWLARLGAMGVVLRTRWRWVGWDGPAAIFDTPEGRHEAQPGALVLALGGASWARLGSDGAWAPLLAAADVPLAPFQPSNSGLRVDWSAHMAPHFGRPLKPVALAAGGLRSRGELVVSTRGLEGGGLYPLTPALRRGAPLSVDLAPDLDAAEAVRRLSVPSRGTVTNRLRKALRLDPVRLALLHEFGRPLPAAPAALVARLKALPIGHGGLSPLDEAISTAGGIRADALTETLMLRALPGVFAAGEMLDWEAPTGGYLLTACLATGRHAGAGAAAWLSATRPA